MGNFVTLHMLFVRFVHRWSFSSNFNKKIKFFYEKHLEKNETCAILYVCE